MTVGVNQNNGSQTPLSPIHLRSAKEIARVFGVKPVTVQHWREKGAPIVLLGKKYQTNYFDLWQWLKNRDIEADAENI